MRLDIIAAPAISAAQIEHVTAQLAVSKSHCNSFICHAPYFIHHGERLPPDFRYLLRG